MSHRVPPERNPAPDIEMQVETRELLEVYCARALELREYSTYRRRISFAIRGAVGVKGVNVESSLPSKEELQAFSSALRKFLTEKDDISFRRVRKIARVEAEMVSPSLVQTLDNLGHEYNLVTTKGPRFEIEGKVFGKKELLDLWFNTEVIHCDIDKLKRWASLKGDWFECVMILEVIAALLRCADIVVDTADLIQCQLLRSRSVL